MPISNTPPHATCCIVSKPTCSTKVAMYVRPLNMPIDEDSRVLWISWTRNVHLTTPCKAITTRERITHAVSIPSIRYQERQRHNEQDFPFFHCNYHISRVRLPAA